MAKKDLLQAVSQTTQKVGEMTKNINNYPVYDIDMDKLVDNNDNFFEVKEDDKFQALVASIREHGILEPLVVFKNEDKATYTIISGHRRKAAGKAAGLTKAPCRVKFYSDEKDKILSLIETNTTTRDMSYNDIIRTIKCYDDIIVEYGIEIKGRKDEWIARRMGMSASTIFRYRNLENLNEEIRNMYLGGVITLRSAVKIGSFPLDKQKSVLRTLQSIIENENIEQVSQEIADKVTNIVNQNPEYLETNPISTIKEVQEASDALTDKKSPEPIKSTTSKPSSPVIEEVETEKYEAEQVDELTEPNVIDEVSGYGDEVSETDETDETSAEFMDEMIDRINNCIDRINVEATARKIDEESVLKLRGIIQKIENLLS